MSANCGSAMACSPTSCGLRPGPTWWEPRPSASTPRQVWPSSSSSSFPFPFSYSSIPAPTHSPPLSPLPHLLFFLLSSFSSCSFQPPPLPPCTSSSSPPPPPALAVSCFTASFEWNRNLSDQFFRSTNRKSIDKERGVCVEWTAGHVTLAQAELLPHLCFDTHTHIS